MEEPPSTVCATVLTALLALDADDENKVEQPAKRRVREISKIRIRKDYNLEVELLSTVCATVLTALLALDAEDENRVEQPAKRRVREISKIRMRKLKPL